MPSGVAYTAVGGTVNEQGVFTAGEAGTAAVTAAAGNLTGTASVTVLSEPTSILLKKEKSAAKFTSAMDAAGIASSFSADYLEKRSHPEYLLPDLRALLTVAP